MEHIKSNQLVVRMIQYLVNPIWTLLNNECSLVNTTSNKMMEDSKFRLIDQTICSINLTENNVFTNMVLNSHVIGLAQK